MPTAAELIDQIAEETGLDDTTDEAPILRAINRAARRIVADTDCLKGAPASIAGDGSTVDVSLSTLTGLRAIDAVYLTDGTTYAEIPQSPVASVILARTQSGPTQYAWEGGALLLDGPARADQSYYLRWAASPTAIVAATTEANVTAYTGIPIDFHEDLLGGLAMVHILEGYEGDEQRAAYYRQLAVEALKRFRQHLVDRGGDELPNSRQGAHHFHTAAPLEIR